MHLARLALALALLVVQAPPMALLVQLYVVSLRLQPTRARENSAQYFKKNKIAKSISKWKSLGFRDGSEIRGSRYVGRSMIRGGEKGRRLTMAAEP